jgi:hypothetical protein
MRFLKQQQLNRRNIKDHKVFYDANGQIVFDSKNVMLVPKGATGDLSTTAVNGHVRYNTTTNQFEFYQNSSWRNVRFKEATTITQQTVGYGDGLTTIFGPLSQTPAAAQNIIVLVENVFQLATTNYTVVQNPTVGGETYTPHTTGSTSIGATTINFQTGTVSPAVFPSVNIVGATINGSAYIQSNTLITNYTVAADGSLSSVTINKPTVTGIIANNTTLTITEGNRTISDNSWWLQFSSAVPYGKPVTVLYGFDQ